MLILKINPGDPQPLFQQVFEQVKGLIETGALKKGDRLPATRTLADELGLHRSTVLKAYQELWAYGYIQSRPGSYSVVRAREEIATFDKRLDKGIIPWQKYSSPASREVYSYFRNSAQYQNANVPPGTIDLASLELDPRLFPIDDFRKCFNETLLSSEPELMNYGDPQGYPALREFIAKRLQIHGIAITADEILVTNGAQNGFELLLKLLTVKDSEVIVESPTYSLVLPLLRYYRNRIVSIPMMESGLCLDTLGGKLKNHRPAFLYTMPNLHNPTGITTSQAHRENLLALCEKHRVPIIEDAFEEEIRYVGKVPLPLKSMDKKHLVIYLGTFSKILFPGLRLGWIAAEDECIKRLLALKKISDLSTNMPIQAAMANFCWKGIYDLHVKRMNRAFRKRMQFALKALRDNLQRSEISWVEPAGGYLLWLQLHKSPVNEREIHRLLARNGVLVTPGKPYFPNNKSPVCFRISISTLNENEINEGILRISQTINKIYDRN
ncbi:PLP-dependent aminotransferase family protein [bacterium]|nr:PLP-dependent aminotransferase family protein [bacterium]